MVDCGLWTGVWRWTDSQGMENIIAWRVWGLGMYCVVHSLLSPFSYSHRVVIVCIHVVALRILLILCASYSNLIIMTQCLF